MRDFVPRWWLYILGLVALWFAVSTVWSNGARKPLLRQQISVTPPGQISVVLDIPYPEKYELLLEFSRAGLPFDTLKRLFGDREDDGLPVHVDWSLKARDGGGTPINRKTSLRGSWSWSQNHVTRYVGEVLVPPGHYVLTMRTLRPTPADDHFPAHASVVIKTNAKSVTTWQLGLAWWMTTINIVLAVASVAATVYLHSVKRASR